MFNCPLGSLFGKYSSFAISYASEFVAAVGAQGYATLAEAIKGATSGSVITMLKDTTIDTANQAKQSAVYIDKSLTLDLNGKTITVSAAQTGEDAGEVSAFVLNNDSEAINVVIKNGAIKTTNAANGIVARKNVNLTLTGLTVDQSGMSEANGYRHSAVTATEGAVVTIENGTYSAEYYALYNKANGGKITVNGGTFTTKGQAADITDTMQLKSAAAHLIIQSTQQMEAIAVTTHLLEVHLLMI